jgi:hypothetical protein
MPYYFPGTRHSIECYIEAVALQYTTPLPLAPGIEPVSHMIQAFENSPEECRHLNTG